MSDDEIREILIKRKIEKKVNAEWRREFIIGLPLLILNLGWIYLIASMPV